MKNNLYISAFLLFSLVFFNTARANPPLENTATLREKILIALSSPEQKQNHFYFMQEKKLAILTKPLITEGELLVNNDASLSSKPTWDVAWIIQKPFSMRYEIYNDHIKEIDSKGERIIPTGNNPIATALTAVMTAAFSGQWEDFNRKPIAAIEATGELAQWQLQVTPHSNDLKKMIKGMTITGKHSQIQVVTMEESNGDSTTIRLQPANDSPKQ